MPTLNFSYNTGTVPLARIIDAFATAYGYKATISDPDVPNQTIPNPESKAEHARRRVKEYIREIVKSQELNDARRTAETSVTEVALT